MSTETSTQQDFEWSLKGKLYTDSLNPRLLRVGDGRKSYFFLRSDLEENHKSIVERALSNPSEEVTITVKGDSIADVSLAG